MLRSLFSWDPVYTKSVNEIALSTLQQRVSEHSIHHKEGCVHLSIHPSIHPLTHPLAESRSVSGTVLGSGTQNNERQARLPVARASHSVGQGGGRVKGATQQLGN